MSIVAIAKSKDAELIALATEIKEGQSAEIIKTDHHDGAIHMSQMIEDAKNSEIKRFGEDIVRGQTAQIEQMKAMIARLS